MAQLFGSSRVDMGGSLHFWVLLASFFSLECRSLLRTSKRAPKFGERPREGLGVWCKLNYAPLALCSGVGTLGPSEGLTGIRLRVFEVLTSGRMV